MSVQYSFTKGLWKMLGTVGMIAFAFATFAGFSDLTLWDLIETYIKPLVGTLTVGGLLKLAINYVKVKNK